MQQKQRTWGVHLHQNGCLHRRRSLFFIYFLKRPSSPAAWRCYQRGVRLSAARSLTSARNRSRAQDHLPAFLCFDTLTHVGAASCVCLSVWVCACVRACVNTNTTWVCMYLLPFPPINSNHPASLAESDDRLGGAKNNWECLWPLYTVMS